MKVNYSNNESKCPFKKGKMADVVKPKRILHRRLTDSDKTFTVNEMHMDLVRILADIGIVLQNTHTISKLLVEQGWIKTKKIERDI